MFTLLAKLMLDASPYEQELDKQKSKTEKSGLGAALGKVGKIGVAAIGAATTAVSAFAAASVKTGADFDKSMSQVAATMGVTTAEIQDLRNFAQDMGAKTAFSATQAADALNYMALAGYDSQQSMEMLPNVLNLAAAGSIDLAAASDMVTDAQSALGLSAEETTVMVDQMAAASSKSNTSVAQLGEAILTIGATARGVSGGTQELSTVLGVLADNGIKGAEGGTHLRNVILSLQTPTKDGAEALKQLGMSYEDMYDEAGNLRSLPEIFQQMDTAMEGMTQQSKDAVISGLFNKTDLASVNALLGTSKDRWDELSGAIGDSAGAAERMANTQLDNLAGDVTLFKSALEGAQIAISDGLSPSLRGFVQLGTKGIQNVTDAFKSGGLKGAVKAFGDFIKEGITMITEMLPDLISAGGEILNAIVEGIAQNLPALATAALGIVMQLGANLPALITNIMPHITETILALVDMLTDPGNIMQFITVALQIITAIGNGLIQAIPQIISRIPQILTAIYTALVEGLPEMLAAGLELAMAFRDAINEGIMQLLTLIGEWIQEYLINPALEAINEFINVGKKVVDNIKDGIASAWQGIVDWFHGIWDSLFGNLNANVTVTESQGYGAAIGSDYIPYNNFPAMLHKGEAVLNAREADIWRRGGSGRGSASVVPVSINVPVEIDGAVIARKTYDFTLNLDDAHGMSLIKA